MEHTKNGQKGQGIGELFQAQTKYTPEKLAGHFLDWQNQPAPFKNYENPIARISLPEPVFAGEPNIWRLLYGRRSRRDYKTRESLSLANLSLLLWATQGITARFGDALFRTAPSAGGLFPIETYLNVRTVDSHGPLREAPQAGRPLAGGEEGGTGRPGYPLVGGGVPVIEGLDAGIYHFRPHKFDLEFLKKGDFSKDIAEAALGQEVVSDAQATFIWSALVARSKWKYRQRAYRYVYLDAGHIAQNLYLAGEALGLGVCAIGAFYDDAVNGIIGLDGVEETVIYMGTVGAQKTQ